MDRKFSITDIDRYITISQNSLSLYSRSDFEYLLHVQNLMMARFDRYLLSQQKEDLDLSIVHCTEAICIPPNSQAAEVSGNHVVQLLFRLAFALLVRSKTFKQSKDVKSSIRYLQYLRGLSIDSLDISRDFVTTLLIQALSTQVELEADGETPNVETMMVLTRDLYRELTSSKATDFPANSLISLIQVVLSEFNTRGRVQLLDQVIEFVRDTVKMFPPDSHIASSALAVILCIRFMESHSNDDYEESTTLLENALDPNQPGEDPDDIRTLATLCATLLTFAKSTFFHNPDSSEKATSHIRTLPGSSSVIERYRPVFADFLASQARTRFEQYSLAESLEEANSYASQAVHLFSSQTPDLFMELHHGPHAARESFPTAAMTDKIRRLKELLSTTPPGTRDRRECLRQLADWYQTKFYRTNDISDIEESIKYGRLALDTTHSSDLSKDTALGFLRNMLFLAFEHTNKANFLDESISLGYDMLKLKGTQYNHFRITRRLVSSLLTRELSFGRREDRLEAIRLISMVIDDQYAQEHDRFWLACQWTIIARSINHPTTSTAYKIAMSLIQKSLSFAPTVSIQHTRLVAMGTNCQNMPLDYASYQIYLGRFEEAIETLEQGRTLLWSEMRGLRPTVTQFIEEDSPLAKRLAQINHELEALTISVAPSGRPDAEDDVAQSKVGMDPFGRLVVTRHKLVQERDALVSQIQGQPGLEGFLKAPSFTSLRSAASRGPVILINHSKWRCDILIVLHNSLPCSLPTPSNFYDRANKLRDELVEARKIGLDSFKYQEALSSVLKGLYKLVGEPVIKRLRLLGVPEQSRVWWCPTSVFCSLPLHAMGPIPSSDTHDRYFSDLYIPSYTPSLSALNESRKTSPQMLEKPSLLLVARPDDSLRGVKGEIKVIQALSSHVAVTGLVSSDAIPASVVDGLRGSQFVHFACHGELEAGKPFEASFKLHEGSRLTLLDIVRSQLPDAEFAFLSCCHTAEITEESVADEALHLTAAMQYCGFRSVVGTMWEMADTDGRDLAKNFYNSLFSSQETGVQYYERSAGALRDATQKLRGKRGISLERWVNFVHYGA